MCTSLPVFQKETFLCTLINPRKNLRKTTCRSLIVGHFKPNFLQCCEKVALSNPNLTQKGCTEMLDMQTRVINNSKTLIDYVMHNKIGQK